MWAAGQADQLLLAERLRDGLRQGGAAVRSSGASTGPAEPPSPSTERRNGQTTRSSGPATDIGQMSTIPSSAGRRRRRRSPSRPERRRASSASTAGAASGGVDLDARRRRAGGLERPVASSAIASSVSVVRRTARSLVPFAPCRGKRGGASLPVQSRSDAPIAHVGTRSEPPHGAATARDPAARRRVSPRAAPDQALHVPPPDRCRGRAASASTTSSASSRIARCRSRWATSSRRCRSATPASRRTSSAPTRTEPAPRVGGRSRRRWSVSEAACKPSSVPRALRRRGDGHPSGAAGHPTAHAADPRAGQRTSPPLTVARRVAPSYLALLRVEFAAFHSVRLAPPAGIVTVALVLASRRTGVTRYPALRSSDFPHADGLPRRRAAIRPPR